MQSTQWDAVIFDYGGVLCYAPGAKDLATYAEGSGLGEAQFLKLYAETRDYYGRAAAGYAAHWHRIADKAGIAISENVVKQFIEKESGLWTRANADTLALAREIKQAGGKIAILSNMTFELLAILRSRFDWLDEFEVQIWSCEHGCAKPDESIYRSCVASLNCEPARALFFDDRPGNVEAAKQFGIDAHVFRSAEQARAVVARGLELS